MTDSFFRNLRMWTDRHSKELANAHNVKDVKRIYMDTVHPDGKITEQQKRLLSSLPWDKVYQWIEADRAARGAMI